MQFGHGLCRRCNLHVKSHRLLDRLESHLNSGVIGANPPQSQFERWSTLIPTHSEASTLIAQAHCGSDYPVAVVCNVLHTLCIPHDCNAGKACDVPMPLDDLPSDWTEIPVPPEDDAPVGLVPSGGLRALFAAQAAPAALLPGAAPPAVVSDSEDELFHYAPTPKRAAYRHRKHRKT